jgi:hypothetical protein
MHYTYFIAIGISLVIGFLIKVAYDTITESDSPKISFKRINNANHKFGEAASYLWLLSTSHGNLAFTDDDIDQAQIRGRKQKSDLAFILPPKK